MLTERGAIACRVAILAAGAWCALFLRHLGVDLPQLKVKASVQRTTPAPLITQSAVGATRAAFRRRQDGGYTIARSGAFTFDITPAALRHFRAFLPALRENWGNIRCASGGLSSRSWPRRLRWSADRPTPFERTRVLDPSPITRCWIRCCAMPPICSRSSQGARPSSAGPGMIDVTPDEIPVLGPVDGWDGLFLATGFSGHGFGIGPAAGYLMAQLARGEQPVVDLAPFRLARFAEGDLTRYPGV